MGLLRRYLFGIFLALIFSIQWIQGSKLKQKQETTLSKFVKLLFSRIIYGFARMIGMEDAVEDMADEFGGGLLAPPKDDDDYRQEDAGDDYYDNDKNDDYSYDVLY